MSSAELESETKTSGGADIDAAAAAAWAAARARRRASDAIARANLVAQRDRSRADARSEARAAAARAEPAELPLKRAMSPKTAAKWRRAFTQALLLPEAKDCGLAAMADDIKASTSEKRAAWSELAARWHEHGFDAEHYRPEMRPSKKSSQSTRGCLVTRRCMTVECGGLASFQQGLLEGSIEKVDGPAPNTHRYRWAAEATGAASEARGAGGAASEARGDAGEEAGDEGGLALPA